MVEFRIEHPNDLATLVVDDGLLFLVPERRHREAPDVVRVRFAIQFAELRKAIERVFGICAFAAVEDPAVFGEFEAADDELDERFEAF